MKHLTKSLMLTCVAATVLAGSAVNAADHELRKEGREAIEKGVGFLVAKQLPDGSWLDDPAVTALVCTALHQSGSEKYAEAVENAVAKGRQVILKRVREDGAFEGSQPKYINYTTATCLYALGMINDPQDKEIVKKARKFLIDLQLDEDNENTPTPKSDPFYGGIGYGSGGPRRPDLSNTQLALEALYVTRHLAGENEGATPEEIRESELAWQKALDFLKEVQNIPEDAEASWVVVRDDPTKDGGFFYRPDQSKASSKYEDERSLRSYGSMTYAGLKSMIYAKLDKDDYRVKAATEWARNNYTLEENPGMGPEGHFYYLQTFAKAFAALDQDVIATVDGEKRDWREDLIRTLLKLQQPDGSWVNTEHGRWMEGIPELVTAYSLTALEIVLSE